MTRPALPTYLPKPRLFITFDDCKESDYTTAYPLMKAAGMRGTSYAISDLIGTDGYCTLAQLQEMYADGWCIGNHTTAHVDLSAISAGELESITACRDWLNANGMPRGADQFAYPFGAGWNVAPAQTHLASIGVEVARRYGGGDYVAITSETNRYSGIVSMMPTYSTTLAQLKAAVRAIITPGGTRSCIITFHAVDDEGGYEYITPTPIFRDFIRWLVTQKSAIRISTMDELEPWLANPRYASWDRAEEAQPSVTQTSAIPAATEFCALSNKAVALNSIAQCTGIQHFQLDSMHGSTEATVDALLKSVSDALLADPATFNGLASPTLDISGNPAPSGTFRPPTGAGGAAASGLESLWAITNHATAPWIIRYNGGVSRKRLADQSLTALSFPVNAIGAGTAGRAYAFKVAARAGLISSIRALLMIPSTALKVAVYADNAGEPGALLAESGASVSGVAGENWIPLTTAATSPSGYVWIGMRTNTASCFYYDGAAGVARYKSLAIGDAWPNPFGAASSLTIKMTVSGWGALTL